MRGIITTGSIPEFFTRDKKQASNIFSFLLELIKLHSEQNFIQWFDYYHRSKNPGMKHELWYNPTHHRMSIRINFIFLDLHFIAYY